MTLLGIEDSWFCRHTWKDFVVLFYHIKETLLVFNEWLWYDVGFLSVSCAYVLL